MSGGETLGKRMAGKMVAYLIIDLDIGIPMLSPAFYYYLVSKDIEKASEY